MKDKEVPTKKSPNGQIIDLHAKQQEETNSKNPIIKNLINTLSNIQEKLDQHLKDEC